MRDRITIDFRKWRDTPHWHFEVERLGEDAHGRWFWMAPGTLLQKGDEPPEIERGGAVVLIPQLDWWAAFWNQDRGQGFELYIDVIAPPRWEPDRVTMVDLDLDVVRDWQGRARVVDEDEFLVHQKTLAYPQAFIDGATRVTRELVSKVAAREEPFGGAVGRWLDRAVR